MSDEHKIKFLEGENGSNRTRDLPEKIDNKVARNLAEEQKSKKLSNKDDGFMTTKHISSARTGVISDNGGPTNGLKIGNGYNNTIWNDKNKKVAKDSQTRVKEQKEEIASNKRVAEQKRMDEMSDKLRQIDQTKGNSVSPAGHLSGSKYYSPKNNMSIFDTQEFERMANKSLGEKLSEDIQKKRSQKDESWKTNGKQVTSSDLIKRYFNKLLEKRE